MAKVKTSSPTMEMALLASSQSHPNGSDIEDEEDTGGGGGGAGGSSRWTEAMNRLFALQVLHSTTTTPSTTPSTSSMNTHSLTPSSRENQVKFQRIQAHLAQCVEFRHCRMEEVRWTALRSRLERLLSRLNYKLTGKRSSVDFTKMLEREEEVLRGAVVLTGTEQVLWQIVKLRQHGSSNSSGSGSGAVNSGPGLSADIQLMTPPVTTSQRHPPQTTTVSVSATGSVSAIGSGGVSGSRKKKRSRREEEEVPMVDLDDPDAYLYLPSSPPPSSPTSSSSSSSSSSSTSSSSTSSSSSSSSSNTPKSSASPIAPVDSSMLLPLPVSYFLPDSIHLRELNHELQATRTELSAMKDLNQSLQVALLGLTEEIRKLRHVQQQSARRRSKRKRESQSSTVHAHSTS
eukprot:scaffold1377_cov198-Ochromonas_danica.AAC.3